MDQKQKFKQNMGGETLFSKDLHLRNSLVQELNLIYLGIELN